MRFGAFHLLFANLLVLSSLHVVRGTVAAPMQSWGCPSASMDGRADCRLWSDQRLARLLPPCHGLEVLEELPLRQRAREALVQRDIGHGAEGDAGDLDFCGNLFTAPAGVDGDGWVRMSS